MLATLKNGMLAVAGMVVVVGLAMGLVYAISEMRLEQKITITAESIVVPTDLVSIQHGQHLASAVGLCVDCHGPNMGGKIDLDDPSLGRVVASNLTRGLGGVGATFSTQDYVRAIRHGVDPSGRLLLFMPSNDYNQLSDADMGAIVAYVQLLPPVDSHLPRSDIRMLGRAFFAAGQLALLPAAAIDQTAPRPRAPEPDVTPQYGEYLATSAGCLRCHGTDLSGGRISGTPRGVVPASNITPAALSDWSEADFLRLMRTGRRPDGRAVDPSMPWPYFAQMTELELRAIWQFLEVVPPRPNGSR